MDVLHLFMLNLFNTVRMYFDPVKMCNIYLTLPAYGT